MTSTQNTTNIRRQVRATKNHFIPFWKPFNQNIPGVNELLNESLEIQDFDPFFEAWHNASFKDLIARTHGAIDNESKALIIQQMPNRQSDFHQFLTENSLIALKDKKPYTNVLNRRFVRRLGKEIKLHMDHLPFSFVHDAVVGASQSCMTRVFTDNAATAVFLKHMLIRQKIPPLNQHQWESTVVYAPSYRFAPQHILEEYAGPTKQELGIEHDRFVLTDEELQESRISGIDDHALLLEVLAYHSAQYAHSRGNLLLPADTVVRNNRVTLVFGNNQSDAGKIYEKPEYLYAAHNTLWTEDGLSRVWNGYMKRMNDTKLQRNDLVEVLSDGSKRLTRSQGDRIPNVVRKPDSILLLVNDPHHVIPPLARVDNADVAVNLIISGLNEVKNSTPQFQPGFSSPHFPSVFSNEELKTRITQLLESNPEIDVFIANSSLPEVEGAIEIVTNGTVQELKGRSIRGTGDKLKRLSNKALSNVTWKDANAYQEALSNLLNHVDAAANMTKVESSTSSQEEKKSTPSTEEKKSAPSTEEKKSTPSTEEKKSVERRVEQAPPGEKKAKPIETESHAKPEAASDDAKSQDKKK